MHIIPEDIVKMEVVMNNQEARPKAIKSLQLITLILNENQSNKFKAIAKEKGIFHGMVIQGKGTVNNHILGLLGIRNQRQNVIDILVEKKDALEIMDYITDKLKINESGHGIAYSTEVNHVELESEMNEEYCHRISEVEEGKMFKKLTVIVNRGMADDVMDVAREFGAKGGTILHGRGTGADCAAKLFGMEIEPEKELIIILLPADIANKVSEAIFKELNLSDPGQGMLFIESISDVRGIVEVTSDK